MRARNNPFRVDRILSIRFEPQGWTFPALMDRLRKLNYRAAIVGSEGTGKTTLLEDLASHLTTSNLTARYLRLDRDHQAFDERALRDLFAHIGVRDVVCLDGCEQLTDAAWRVFQRRTAPAGGLIVTTHQPGRLPTLVECSTTPSLLRKIVERLTMSGYPFDETALLARHRGNIRDALRALYDDPSIDDL